MSLFDLTGHTAVVTGSTKGIGLAIVREMAAAGANVVVSSRDQGLCEKVAAAINDEFGGGRTIAKAIAFDLEERDSIRPFTDAAQKAFGGVDTLVCNAAVMSLRGPGAFDRTLTGNIHHNYRLCESFRPAMAARGGGSMILIGSVSGHTAQPKIMAYSTSKAGLAHLARCLADETAGQNIRVNCLAPGLIRSEASETTLGEAGLAAAAPGIPLRRVGEPEEIAGAVIFLASRAGAYVTGTTLWVDGGRTFLPADRLL